MLFDQGLVLLLVLLLLHWGHLQLAKQLSRITLMEKQLKKQKRNLKKVKMKSRINGGAVKKE